MRRLGDTRIPSVQMWSATEWMLINNDFNLRVPYVIDIDDNFMDLSDNDKLLLKQFILWWLNQYPVKLHPMDELQVLCLVLMELGVADEVIDDYFCKID